MKACQHAASASRSSEDGAGRPGPRAKFMRAIRSCFLAPVRTADFGLADGPRVTCNSIEVRKKTVSRCRYSSVNTCPRGARPRFSNVVRAFPYLVQRNRKVPQAIEQT